MVRTHSANHLHIRGGEGLQRPYRDHPSQPHSVHQIGGEHEAVLIRIFISKIVFDHGGQELSVYCNLCGGEEDVDGGDM